MDHGIGIKKIYRSEVILLGLSSRPLYFFIKNIIEEIKNKSIANKDVHSMTQINNILGLFFNVINILRSSWWN